MSSIFAWRAGRDRAYTAVLLDPGGPFNQEVIVNEAEKPSVSRLVLVPAVITLAVTLLRLAGERMGGSNTLFNRAAGGGGALIGIVWLVPLFGLWFGWRLARAGEGPASVGRAAGYGLLATLVGGGISAAGVLSGISWLPVLTFVLGVVVSYLLARQGWPELSRVLLAYGLAARIPVALVMLAAIYGNWGTHYDVPPPGFNPTVGPFMKWFLIGLLPQLTVWIGFTLGVGTLVGAAGAAWARRGTPRAALGQAG